MNQGKLASDPLTFNRPGGGYLQLGSTALAVMLGYVQDEPIRAEAGGVLLGRHIRETTDIIVDRVTTPQPGDRRSRSRYFRSRHRHQVLIDRAWQESSWTCTYLGEWHTHPEPIPTPSIVDRIDWRRKLIVDVFSAPIFFVIVGTAEMRAWEGHHFAHLAPLLWS